MKQETKTIDRPVFVIGVGRCGSSIFHSLLSHHSQLAWVSSYLDQKPAGFSVHRRLLSTVDIPIIGRIVRRKFHAREAYDFWDTYFRGFSTPCRDLRRDDVSEVTKRRVQKVFAELTTEKRSRLLVKITGWPRMGALVEMFPDAKFIHIVRDGHAVANSLLQVPWWWGWRGPQNWRFGTLSNSDQADWEKHGRSFVALAGIEWRMVMDAAEEASTKVPVENFLKIHYEDLCQNKDDIFKSVLQFCDLEPCNKLQSVVRSTELRNTNDKWTKDLSPAQQAVLRDVLKVSRAKHGYSEP